MKKKKTRTYRDITLEDLVTEKLATDKTKTDTLRNYETIDETPFELVKYKFWWNSKNLFCRTLYCNIEFDRHMSYSFCVYSITSLFFIWIKIFVECGIHQNFNRIIVLLTFTTIFNLFNSTNHFNLLGTLHLYLYEIRWMKEIYQFISLVEMKPFICKFYGALNCFFVDCYNKW